MRGGEAAVTQMGGRGRLPSGVLGGGGGLVSVLFQQLMLAFWELFPFNRGTAEPARLLVLLPFPSWLSPGPPAPHRGASAAAFTIAAWPLTAPESTPPAT